MKKNVFIGILTIFPFLLISQNKNIDFGIKGGINYANYIDNIDLNLFTHIPADYNGKIGFYIGAYSTIGINELISIKPELVISKTGSKATIELKDLRGIYTSQDILFYQETKAVIDEYNVLIPILLNLHLNKYFFEIGPQFGYAFSRKIAYKDGPINSQLILKNSNSENFEFAGAIGFGYRISELYQIDIRYSYGFTERQHLNSSILYFGLSYKL
tara:strand:- start:3411 stop:4055 length:645 start_codon:yes stop_codon:yes gene_type:complete